MSFLPVCKEDMIERNWGQLDFLFISGDAYVDHPSFGHAIITRVLESEGYRVGIIAQPDWNNLESFKILGRPKYAVLISSGVIDSMVNHYTVNKKIRNSDTYTPGGKYHKRPDRALIVYSNKIRQVFGKIPIIIGGVEASLRRFAHYDYWSDSIRKSILIDSQADILVYGMGEKPILEIAKALKDGINIKDINEVRGTVYTRNIKDFDIDMENFISSGECFSKCNKYAHIYSYDEVKSSKIKYAKAFKIQFEEQDPKSGKILIQENGNIYIVQNPPQIPLNTKEMDKIYALPYERNYHPSYENFGKVPALEEVKFSITSHRGCFGGCSFCSINFHQGRIIQKRSKASIINEAQKLTWLEDFKGYIHDIGGPTSNFRNKACKKQNDNSVCKTRQCLYPEPCKNLIIDHSEYLDILKSVQELENIKKVFIRSGIRYDYLIYDKNDTFFYEMCKNNISGPDCPKTRMFLFIN